MQSTTMMVRCDQHSSVQLVRFLAQNFSDRICICLILDYVHRARCMVDCWIDVAKRSLCNERFRMLNDMLVVLVSVIGKVSMHLCQLKAVYDMHKVDVVVWAVEVLHRPLDCFVGGKGVVYADDKVSLCSSGGCAVYANITLR